MYLRAQTACRLHLAPPSSRKQDIPIGRRAISDGFHNLGGIEFEDCYFGVCSAPRDGDERGSWYSSHALRAIYGRSAFIPR